MNSMKNKFSKIFLILLGGIMASCLEDDKQPLDPTTTQNVVEFLDPSVPSSPSGSVYPAYSQSFLYGPTGDYEVILSYSGPRENDKDITIELEIDPSALNLYNTQMEYGIRGADGLHGTVYDLMPEENYSIPVRTFTIPAGQTKVAVPIRVFPQKFDFSKNFAVPLRIVSASSGVISQNFSVAILNLGVRNNYDGIYEIVGGKITRFQAPPAPSPDPALSGNYVPDLTIDLTTLSATSLAFAPVWKDGSGIAGIDGTSITINETTNALTIKSSTNPVLKMTPGSVNKYDPATREFTINIDWGSGATVRIIEGMKLRYVGPRP